ncbi:hypothetical protein MPTK1_3g02340 [Marchantia polymorpha subsp. ruderalis]|uniref:Uncharacterized protein n=2 Tax=Marchantia polymorpha TaxID=3197 RepID=A0AAF6AWN8_MARPO|nr:hypothetical protein MARPO_0007s0223 [Marchantia polymorpha]BBN04172.1 hypothetical protein Mp_3g02340 [Marchantia polymorpha subsp. ruderalis]|eukprot:PTQ47859.1 hypothetical protein MARPO_0007s0223 [Marchantia polymorpha]
MWRRAAKKYGVSLGEGGGKIKGEKQEWWRSAFRSRLQRGGVGAIAIAEDGGQAFSWLRAPALPRNSFSPLSSSSYL